MIKEIQKLKSSLEDVLTELQTSIDNQVFKVYYKFFLLHQEALEQAKMEAERLEETTSD